jgi:predicted  nucleic acid-binding Zn-ribbon protein
MKELLQQLIELQSLEFSESNSKNIETSKAALRAKIAPQILGHFDRLATRGKKPLAAVSGQVCTGCHMRVPLGAIMTLKHGNDIQLCENCGRYLYLLPDAEPEAAELAAAAKPKKKSRKPAKSLQAA